MPMFQSVWKNKDWLCGQDMPVSQTCKLCAERSQASIQTLLTAPPSRPRCLKVLKANSDVWLALIHNCLSKLNSLYLIGLTSSREYLWRKTWYRVFENKQFKVSFAVLHKPSRRTEKMLSSDETKTEVSRSGKTNFVAHHPHINLHFMKYEYGSIMLQGSMFL